MRFQARRALTPQHWRYRTRGFSSLPRLIRGCGFLCITVLFVVLCSRLARLTDSVAVPAAKISEPLNQAQQPPPGHVPIIPPSDSRPAETVSRNEVVVAEKQHETTTTLQPRIATESEAPLQLNEIGVAKSSQFQPRYLRISHSPKHVADIAFFLQLSESSVKMAPRLIDRLWHERNIILIHVDAKAPEKMVNDFKSRYSDKGKYSNIHFLPRESITYMGVTMILNTLSAVEYLLSLDQHWDYFINISGSCYPTVSVQNMRKILGQPRVLKQKVSFLQIAPNIKFWGDLKQSRFDLVFHDPAIGLAPGAAKETKLLETNGQHPLKDQLGIRFVHSEAWVTVHRSLATTAVRGSFARRLLVLLSNMKDPEEHFWPTLAWNVPELNRTLAHHAMRSVYWNLHGKFSGQHPYTIDQHREPNGDYSFWPKVKASPAFFVRKFSTPDSELMNMIDKYKSGVHPQPSMTSVQSSLKEVIYMTMCHADIERHWNSHLIVPCFKGGNL